ncbi:MAG: radical SAM family heme chaperone HemW [Caulobacteraceae bacterium]
MTGAAPVSLYVHWPYCARICPYCDFNVVRDRGRVEEQTALVAAIAADIRAFAAVTGPRRLVSIFFGGGTPSLMEPAAVAGLIDVATGHWRAADDLEITLEANPTDAEAARFAGLAAAGVNRLSLGVQSLDDAALAFLGRNHDAATARRAVAVAAAAFPRLSVDLIYARPGQSVAGWERELTAAVALGPEHISPYQLTIEPGTAFHRAVSRGDLKPPGPDLAADLHEATQSVLSAAGFEAYEVSNHARGAAARSRHNLAGWRGEDYVGVGPGAHGRLTLAGARRFATATPRKIGDYIALAGEGAACRRLERLSAREAASERLLMGLRTLEGVSMDDLVALAGVAARAIALDGFVTIAAGRMAATVRGRLVLDRLIAELVGDD